LRGTTSSPGDSNILSSLYEADASTSRSKSKSSIQSKNESDSDDSTDDEPDLLPHQVLFQKLLKEVVGGPIRQLQWPSQVDPRRLRSVIHREFRDSGISADHDASIRNQLAFLALRELNQKYMWHDRMQQNVQAKTSSPVSTLTAGGLPDTLTLHNKKSVVLPARYVTPLPRRPAYSYLRPGAFLIAHPCLTGYFRRAVICILDHTPYPSGTKRNSDDDDDDDSTISLRSNPTRAAGTYGLVVNRPCVDYRKAGQNLSLAQVIRPLPESLLKAFDGARVHEGGPVQISLQMIHAIHGDGSDMIHNNNASSGGTDASGEEEKSALEQIGGQVIPMIDDLGHDVAQNAYSDSVVRYRGNVALAAKAVLDGTLSQEDLTFFVGASSWVPGQLESEMERGCWLPCQGPPIMTLHGRAIVNYEGLLESNADTPHHHFGETGDDMWLSMLAACGKEEQELAQWMVGDTLDLSEEYGEACDSF
jgi:putative AlgH/UPF0301 family transcriptional regulator